MDLGTAIDKVGRLVHVDPEPVPGEEHLELGYPLLPPGLGHRIRVVGEVAVVRWPDLGISMIRNL